MPGAARPPEAPPTACFWGSDLPSRPSFDLLAGAGAFGAEQTADGKGLVAGASIRSEGGVLRGALTFQRRSLQVDTGACGGHFSVLMDSRANKK